MSRRTRSIVILLGVIMIAFGIVNAARSATRHADSYTRARQIINSVFPRATRARALRVAACETVHFTDFYNNRSGAKGLYQEMPGNHHRILHWRGRSLRINWYRISRHGPDRYAAIVALYQSRGGTSWSEWNASRSCWA